MSVDESLLGGESAAVRNLATDIAHDAVAPPGGGGDDQPFLYSGTLVVQGKGMARVVATGERTALWWIVAGGLLMLGLALFVPFMNALFHFQTPPLDHLALTLAITTAILTLMASPRSAPGQTVGHR